MPIRVSGSKIGRRGGVAVVCVSRVIIVLPWEARETPCLRPQLEAVNRIRTPYTVRVSRSRGEREKDYLAATFWSLGWIHLLYVSSASYSGPTVGFFSFLSFSALSPLRSPLTDNIPYIPTPYIPYAIRYRAWWGCGDLALTPTPTKKGENRGENRVFFL